MTAITTQEFNCRPGRAITLAQKEPVFITHRGEIQYVLMSIDDYAALRASERVRSKENPFVVDDDAYFEFEIPRTGEHLRIADLAFGDC